ncbi:MAG: type II secretion system inner membrane protein GspF [Pseudomonadota bacterium]|nr:type II secretion system inner membrane protein GspF [Pseudomonadota bacterium]
MAAFSYIAIDSGGKQQKGVVDADSARQVRQILREKGLMATDVSATIKDADPQKGFSFSFGRPSLSVADLALITRQMATLIQAGIPLEEALGTVARQSDKSSVNSILLSVRSKVLEGYTLADAMAEYPSVFSNLYRSTVSAGESAGFLDVVMDKLADYTESSQAARQKIQMAMIYPVMLFLMAVGVVALLMVFVVPDVVKVFSAQGQGLPWITRALIATSDFIVNRGWLIIVALFAVVFGIKKLLSKPSIELNWHRQLLTLPLIGRLSRGTNTAQFASTLSILTASGVPLVEALKIAGEVLANQWLRQRVSYATQQVQEGTSLNRALSEGGYFPPMMLHMIASGEQSGQLDQMLERIASAQQRDLESLVSVMLGVLEPLMLLFMGVCVFAIVVAILLPIVNLNSLV